MKRLILALLTGVAFAASSPGYAAVKTIVLVHGAFADGSGWKPVADILQRHGYAVRVVREPETSFAADVAATRRVLDKAGPCVLVGHSYGGGSSPRRGCIPTSKVLPSPQPATRRWRRGRQSRAARVQRRLLPARCGACPGRKRRGQCRAGVRRPTAVSRRWP